VRFITRINPGFVFLEFTCERSEPLGRLTLATCYESTMGKTKQIQGGLDARDCPLHGLLRTSADARSLSAPASFSLSSSTGVLSHFKRFALAICFENPDVTKDHHQPAIGNARASSKSRTRPHPAAYPAPRQ